MRHPHATPLSIFLLLLATLGLVLPWYFNIKYFMGGGSVAPSVFFADAGANALTTAITFDVYIAALAFSTWVVRDLALSSRIRLAYVVACFGIGLSFALPLYLAQKIRSGASR